MIFSIIIMKLMMTDNRLVQSSNSNDKDAFVGFFVS